MSEELNFDDLLNSNLDSQTFDRTPPLPPGSYAAMVKDYKKTDKPSQKGNHGIVFTFSFLQAKDDVDEDALAKALERKPMKDRTMQLTFYMTPNAAHRIREFIEMLGVDHSGRTLKECLPETKGCGLTVHVKHTPSRNNPEESFAEIGGFTKDAA
jgi:hypothetical protein